MTIEKGITGRADFTETKSPLDVSSLGRNAWKGTEVEISIRVKGLKPGLHGVHLHGVGKCEPDFKKGITGEPDSGVSGGPRVACGVIEKKS